MNAPRVSDERIKNAIEAYEKCDNKFLTFNIHFVIKALRDLQDARDQLKTHQEMRSLYNKEPE